MNTPHLLNSYHLYKAHECALLGEYIAERAFAWGRLNAAELLREQIEELLYLFSKSGEVCPEEARDVVRARHAGKSVEFTKTLPTLQAVDQARGALASMLILDGDKFASATCSMVRGQQREVAVEGNTFTVAPVLESADGSAAVFVEMRPRMFSWFPFEVGLLREALPLLSSVRVVRAFAPARAAEGREVLEEIGGDKINNMRELVRRTAQNLHEPTQHLNPFALACKSCRVRQLGNCPLLSA